MRLLLLLLQRVATVVVVMWGAATIVFGVLRLSGDPAVLFASPDAGPEALAQIRRTLGFDRPIHVQYAEYILHVATGDFGQSVRYNQPVGDMIRSRLPATLLLATSALVIATVIGVLAGIVSAFKRNTLWDRFAMFGSLFGQSIPPFWLGIMLVLVFAVGLRWLPTSGDGTARHLILPAFTVGAYMAARISRLTRAAFLEVLGQDYLRTARSKGLRELAILLRHTAPNAAIPVITVLSVTISTLIGGSIAVEMVFAWPGIGQLMVQGVLTRDYPLVQGTVLIVSLLVAVTSLITDVLYVRLDPRIRLT